MDAYKKFFDKYNENPSLDSAAFVEIPENRIINPAEYRHWLTENIEMKWMHEFNENQHYWPTLTFNQESGIGGKFGSVYIIHSKLYRFDGTLPAFSENDYRAKRGFLIRDHYSKQDVGKVQLLTDNLVDFLTQEKIEHIRTNYQR